MPRHYTLGVRLSPEELQSLRNLTRLRHYEGAGQLVRALIREELCRREGQSTNDTGNATTIEGTAGLVDAGIP